MDNEGTEEKEPNLKRKSLFSPPLIFPRKGDKYGGEKG